MRHLGAVLFAIAGCSCGGPTAPSQAATAPASPVTRVFVSGLEWIDTFTMSATGELTTGLRLTPTRGILPETVVAAGGSRLYLSNLVGIEGYRIDSVTGAIAPLPGSPFTTERGALAHDPLERYVWQRWLGAIQAFRIDAATGQLAASGPPTPTSPFLTLVVVEGRGAYAYGFADQQLAGYRIEVTGVLTPIEGSPWPLPREGANPVALRAGTGAASALLFFASQGDGGQPSSVLVYRIDPSTGIPQPAFLQPAPVDRVASDIVGSPSGAFVYVVYRNKLSTDERPALVSALSVDAASGRLTEMASITTGRTFFSDIAIAPDGSTLLVTLEPSPFVLPLAPADLAVIRVEGGASLTLVPGSPYRVGPDPHTMHVFETRPAVR